VNQPFSPATSVSFRRYISFFFSITSEDLRLDISYGMTFLPRHQVETGLVTSDGESAEFQRIGSMNPQTGTWFA